MKPLSRLFGSSRKINLKSLPHYRAIFIWIFVVSQVATISIEGYYLAMGQETVASFILDALLLSFIAGGLLYMAYLLVARVLSAYIEENGMFEDLVNNSPDSIYYLDGDGRVNWVNGTGLETFGYAELESVRGRRFAELVHPHDREQVLAAFDGATGARNRVTEGLTFRMLRHEGAVVWVELHAHTVYDENGEPLETVGVLRDITTRKKYEDALERANTELEGYAHTVSHDLKNPLAKVMLAGGGILQLGGHPEIEAARDTILLLAEEVMASAEKANNLVEDLLSLAESGQSPSGVYRVDVAEKVREVLADEGGEITGKGVEVLVDSDMGKVIAAPTHVYQLFSNLVRNAIKYNDSAKPFIEIRYQGCENGGGHRYQVHDNGPGIPVEIADKVFTPFVRGETGETGVGLSIVEKIVRAYGGSIEARNDGGASFEFTLKDWDPGSKARPKRKEPDVTNRWVFASPTP